MKVPLILATHGAHTVVGYVPGLSIFGHVSRGVAKLMMKEKIEERREGRRGRRGRIEGGEGKSLHGRQTNLLPLTLLA